MSLTIDTQGISNFEKSPTTNIPLFDIALFKDIYTDNELLFFNLLFPKAREMLIKSISVLDNAIKENDNKEWQRCILGLNIIAKSMLFHKLEKCQINNQTPNVADYYILKRCIRSTLNVANFFVFKKNKKKHNSIHYYLEKWCCL